MNGSAAPPPENAQLPLPGTGEAAETPIGRGFNTLLQGSSGEPELAAPLVESPAPRALPHRSFYFFLDLLFLILATVIVFSASGPLSAFQWILCAISVCVGAVCSIIPFASGWTAKPAPLGAPGKWKIQIATDDHGSERAYIIHEHFPRFVGEISAEDGAAVQPTWLDTHTLSPQGAQALVAEGLRFYQEKRPERILSKRQFSRALRPV